MEANSLKPKYATRTVLLDKDGKVAIINVTKHGYYKIPGGGIEDREDVGAAAQREVLEESGCDCCLVNKLGRLETEIPVWGLLDISDGFIAKVVGKKDQPKYEQWENERGFKIEWFNNLDSAIATIEQNKVKEPGMDVLQARDLMFLKLARKKLSKSSARNHIIDGVVVALVAIITILSCMAFNYCTRGVWTLPFWRKSVATIKTVNRNSAEKKYYTIYSNGAKVEISDTSALVEREGDEVAHFAGHFTTTDVISAKSIDGETIYCASEGECYDELPAVSDQDLLGIEVDLAEKIRDLHLMTPYFFRDGEKIYIAGLRDTGFGGNSRKIYTYDMISHNLKFLISFPADEEIEWVYTEG